MKVDLRIIGLIICTITIGVFVSIAIYVNSQLPEYNYHSYSGWRVPSWLSPLTAIFTLIGFWLIAYGYRKHKQNTIPLT